MLNKKIHLFVVLLVIFCFSSFAQNVDKVYTVTKINGTVFVKDSNDFWVKIDVNTNLLSSSKIKTGLDSKLSVSDGNKVYSINQLKVGILSELIGERTKVSTGKKALQSTVTVEEQESKKGISTAATRADSQEDKEINEWAEDDED